MRRTRWGRPDKGIERGGKGAPRVYPALYAPHRELADFLTQHPVDTLPVARDPSLVESAVAEMCWKKRRLESFLSFVRVVRARD